MTAPRLPEDMERALTEAIGRAASIGYDEAPDDKHYSGNASLDLAIDRAMESDKTTALRAAIAAHVATGVSASFDAGYLSLLLSKLSPAEWGVLPLNLMPGKRQLCHVESDEGAPAGQGVGVCSVPKRYERLASFMVGAVNALAAHLRPKPGVKPESAGCGGAHRAPDSPSFEASLTALDVENDYAPDRGTTYAIVGLDDVRAAHAEAVRVAVEAERAACLKACKDLIDSINHDGECPMLVVHAYEVHGAEKCIAAICARGAKS